MKAQNPRVDQDHFKILTSHIINDKLPAPFQSM